MGSAPPPKKILIMTFDDNYSTKLAKILIKRNITIDDKIGFSNWTNYNKNTIYTFLSGTMRKIWMHHFTGTNAVIFIMEGSEGTKSEKEIVSYLINKNLIGAPILILVDRNKKSENYEREIAMELLRKSLNDYSIKYNVMNIDFENITPTNSANYGLDWIENEIRMKK